MACPDCGSPVGDFQISTSIETHGLDCGPFERFDQEFILCRNCGGKFDVSDWEDTPELSESANDRETLSRCKSQPAHGYHPAQIPRGQTETATSPKRTRCSDGPDR